MILITGATGFVGSHLLLHLVDSITNVRALFRTEDGKDKTRNLFKLYNKLDLFKKIDWVKADVLDVTSLEIAFDGITTVYHCAAYISFDPKDELQLRKVNIEGTANIVNFCIDKKVSKICFVSSIAALGDVVGSENSITESAEWNPEKQHSDYAISKYGAEMEIWRGYQEGIKAVIVNPGIIIGSGFCNQSSGTLFTLVKNNLLFYPTGSSGFISVTDVVQIMQKLMNSDTFGERFILVSENTSYKAVLSSIAEKIKVKIPTQEANSFILNIAWRLDWLISKLSNKKRKLTKYTVASLLNKSSYSNDKIKNTLGYSFQSVDDAIIEAAKYFK